MSHSFQKPGPAPPSPHVLVCCDASARGDALTASRESCICTTFTGVPGGHRGFPRGPGSWKPTLLHLQQGPRSPNARRTPQNKRGARRFPGPSSGSFSRQGQTRREFSRVSCCLFSDFGSPLRKGTLSAAFSFSCDSSVTSWGTPCVSGVWTPECAQHTAAAVHTCAGVRIQGGQHTWREGVLHAAWAVGFNAERVSRAHLSVWLTVPAPASAFPGMCVLCFSEDFAF